MSSLENITPPDNVSNKSSGVGSGFCSTYAICSQSLYTHHTSALCRYASWQTQYVQPHQGMPLVRFGLHSRVDQANRPIYFLLDMERVRVYYNACLMCGIHLFTCCDVLFSTRYAFAAILKSLYTLAKLVGVLHL